MDLQTAQAIIAAQVGKDAKNEGDRELADAIAFLVCSSVAGIHRTASAMERIAAAMDRAVPADVSPIIGVRQ